MSAPNPVGKPPPTFCLKTEHLDPPMIKNNTVVGCTAPPAAIWGCVAPPAAIWFCVVASFNSDFEINYLFWSDRTGWFVYRRLGASNLEFNNPQNLLVRGSTLIVWDCSSLQRCCVHFVSAPNPVGKPPQLFASKRNILIPR